MTIQKAAVIGAGVMGSGIAAQIANAGVPVLLLDLVPEGAADRNALAAGALARMAKADPAPFMSREAIRL
ncbi:MAG: 3-hydroxyacyl-CoA dehydrogenase, partial [Geminicoccaceae bacterium]|nr:3-hydroxyacyl-CoA dehydrogenase [Geminicoccaceae bacterium]